MSHFVTVCLLPPGTKEEDFEEKISKLIAPYDENTQVAPRKEPCYCIGRAARQRAREAADTKYGTIDFLRTSFAVIEKEIVADNPVGKPPGKDAPKEEVRAWNKLYSKLMKKQALAWKKHTSKRVKYEEKLFEASKDKKKPNPECSECQGTGKSETTYNPKSKWDWWVIGGRWPDFFAYDGYDPEKDPDNYELCHLCKGKKVRPCEPDKGATCNACGGTGQSMKFRLKVYRAHAPVSEILRHWKKDPKIPYAMVGPNGRWIEKGQMGWWGLSSNEKKEPDWRKKVLSIYEAFPNYIAVAVDMHI